MKHAILILAHKDFGQLRHLIEYFIKDCSIYVHIDKKAVISDEELSSIACISQVRAVYRKYNVHWGGHSILKTEIFLLRQVVKDGGYDYIHLISGQDYPIKPLDEFLSFFEKKQGKEFIRYANIPNPRWDQYTFSRFQYYFPYDYINKESKDAIKWMQKIINLEHKLGIKRRIPDQFDHLYGSTQWFSITYEATKAIIHYTSQHPSFYHRARWTFAAEEYYIATVLVNIVGKSRIVPSDLRFIIWREENGNCPANLGMKHFHALASSKDFYFARKMEYPICADLVHNIDTYLLKQSAYEVTKTGGWRYDGLMRYSYDYNILREIYKTCRSLKILNVLDIGCGAGFYTAALRKRGIPTAGYDANPYTPKLSSLLLPKNDELCGVADLTDNIEVDSPFDLVLSMDTLSCIPMQFRDKAVQNIARLSKRYILIIEAFQSFKKGLKSINEYEISFQELGFKKDELGTSILNQNLVRNHKLSLLLAR